MTLQIKKILLSCEVHRLSLGLGDCWVWVVSASALMVTVSSVVRRYRVIKLLHGKEWETLETTA